MIYLFIVLFLTTSSVDASDPQLSECQYLVTKLEQIKQAKRKGGSSRYMNALNREKNDINKRYFRLHCSMTKELLRRD
ncbi:MAG: hypothetical protein ACKVJE_21415 [Pseudomonadales bacterium]